ncbi:PLP-dependent aminotransferase family protein [Vibrio sp. J1-1]|uniref:MocR-like pyridoxine biosynthesis transcription factor PdxR n=1 Tax=Vibrio sp. J1-1 TaxID=2912251 RepID=UPI001F35BBC1|nr:PLP-dependent aminotransferase family protein [Vibrio sp. J1-1]MCF7480244.1 PLP-dependent aminotransferase family protein [Vibrio sp. J1-1]
MAGAVKARSFMLQGYIHIDPLDSRTLQEQIKSSISQAIFDGFVSKHRSLESSRKLAQSLSVSRNTVLRVYDQLTDEGLLISVERKGYFVNPELEVSEKKAPERVLESERQLDWEKYLIEGDEAHGSTANNLKNYPYLFVHGQVDEDLFPVSEWRKCAIQSLNKINHKSWTSDDNDYHDLIEQIRTRVLPNRGIFVDEDQIALTHGCQNSLYLISKLLVSRYTKVGFENPGYPEALQQFRARRANVQPLEVDREGMVVDDRLDSCQLVYTTPSNQFPTTVRMSSQRRKRLMEKAEQEDLLVIEDDFEHDINFIDDKCPALRSEYPSERIIYISSFSSIIAPGLRLGFIVASPPLIKQIRQVQQRMHSLPPKNNCQTLALFISLGYYDSLIQKMLKKYREKWLTMEKALNTYFPQSGVTPSLAGTAFWIDYREDFDAGLLEELAKAHGILINNGAKYYTCEKRNNSFRLSFQSIKNADIRSGIEKLAQLAKKILPIPRVEDAEGVRLNGKRIRELLSDRVVLTRDCFNIPYRITFQADGKMTGVSDRPNDADEGYWWIENNHFMYQWRNCQFADVRRVTVILDGDSIKRFGEDGYFIGDATLIGETTQA